MLLTTSLDSPDSLSTKAREGEPLNVFVDGVVAATGGMNQMEEAPVSLVPGHNQVPDPSPATVILGKENPYFASTVRRPTTSKKDVLLVSKTIHPVSDMMAPPIFLSR